LAQIGSRLGLSKQAVHKASIRNNLLKNEAGKYALEDVGTALKAEQSELIGVMRMKVTDMA
jgi:hypothetical protein